MNRLTAKLKNPFFKEVLLATVLFTLPFLLWVHVWMDKESFTVFNILGYEYHHKFSSDRVGVWVSVSHLIPISYLILFFYNYTKRIKYFSFILLFFLVQSMVSNLLFGFFNNSETLLSIFSILGSLSILIYFSLSRRIAKFKGPNTVSSLNFKVDIGIYVILIIIATSFWLLPNLLPNVNTKKLEYGLVVIQSYGFGSVKILLWVLSLKAVVLLPLAAWFILEKKWWKYSLLSPILITAYQARNMFIGESGKDIFDEYEVIQALPLLGIVLIILLALSKNAKDVYLFKAIYQKSYTKLEGVVKKRHHKKLQDLEAAKQELANYQSSTSKGKLEDLQALKDRLEKTLRKDA